MMIPVEKADFEWFIEGVSKLKRAHPFVVEPYEGKGIKHLRKKRKIQEVIRENIALAQGTRSQYFPFLTAINRIRVKARTSGEGRKKFCGSRRYAFRWHEYQTMKSSHFRIPFYVIEQSSKLSDIVKGSNRKTEEEDRMTAKISEMDKKVEGIFLFHIR